MYLLPYKFDEKIKRKATDFWINILTLCSPLRGEVKRHYFPKPPHSWSKSRKVSCADWNVALAGETHQASEVSNLEFLAVQPKNPDAPLSDSECHLQEFPTWGPLENIQDFSSSGHFCILPCHGHVHWGVAGQVVQNQSILPILQSRLLYNAFNNFPLGNHNTSAFMNCLGDEMGSLLSAENPISSLLYYLHVAGTQ